ncbi:Pre-mrna-splicing factor slu7 [Rhizoctonia solani]|uniref:Pre-mRNA-splicing factor SLU7 n=1 Tax=Rhizoctonia solani TaxID=456999 RepID=A0A8H7IGR5_9AGAM|nr:Pre-mrna-splicing factor slu7 [Rhizoctonia solani]
MALLDASKLSREEFRRQKDLDAARKAGTAPAELDEQGRPINPHIPQYISKAPWYLDTGAPSLAHQRRPDYDASASKLNDWYDRGAKAGPAATKYRKGACENCGAMTHKRQDCLERPRKKGAKYTNQDIAPDEVIQDIQAGYDAKRDRWNGYDPAEHSKIYDEYAAIEAARQKLREEQIDSQTDAAVRKVAKAGGGGNDEFGSSDEEDADEDKYADSADAYLINLDPSSAYYDPKTRSMRDNPNKNVNPEDSQFAGDNFLRNSGEAVDVQKLQLFAWQSAARGNDVHLNANPTQGEILHHQYKEKKDHLKNTSKVGILAKYGGEEYLEKAPKELLNGQTEDYVEYSRTGQVIKGRERAKAKSNLTKLNSVYVNNHISVWGSWYQVSTGKWGYACCHSTLHGSYCAGEAGIEASEAAKAQNLLNPRSLLETHLETSGKGKERANVAEDPSLSKKRLGEKDVALDKEKLQRAIAEEKKRKKGELDDDGGDKRRKFSSGYQDVTEEELGGLSWLYRRVAHLLILTGRGLSTLFLFTTRADLEATLTWHTLAHGLWSAYQLGLTPRARMSSMFRKKASSRKSVDAYSESDHSESDVSNAPTPTSRVESSKPISPTSETPTSKREPMSSEAWTVIILLIIGIIGRLCYAKFGGIELYLGSIITEDESLWGTVLRDLNAQIMRISARAAAGVFAGLAGRLVLDLASGSAGQAVRFTASLLGISLGMLFSEVIRGVFDEKDHWENRTVTHIHKSSHRLRKSSGRRRRTTSTSEIIDDPDLTDDPHSVAATSIAATALTSQPAERRTHRRALSERDSQHAETIGLGTIPSVFSGDLEAEIAELRRQASTAAGQQHKYQEEQKYEYARGNKARALQLECEFPSKASIRGLELRIGEVKRYEALAESLTRQVGDKIVEERTCDTVAGPAFFQLWTATRWATQRSGGYYSESDTRRKVNPVRVTVSAGGETYEVTAEDEEVEIGPNLRVRTRHVYQPPITQPQEPASISTQFTPPIRPAPARAASVTPTPSPARPPRSVPRSKANTFTRPAGDIDEDVRAAPVGSRAKGRSKRESD